MVTYYHIYAENFTTGKAWDVADFTKEEDARKYLKAYCNGMGYDFIENRDGDYVYGELKDVHRGQERLIRVNIVAKNIFENYDESIQALQRDDD